MARNPDDNDDSDSDDIPKPNKAEIDRILRAVIPRTPDWLKEKTAETRGQAFAHYDGSGAPAKAQREDTLDIAGPVVVDDDTSVDGFKLSPLTLQRIEKRREEAERRNDSTVSVAESIPVKRRSIYPILALLLVGVVGVVIWITRSKSMTTVDVPIPPATSSVAAIASSPLNVPPVPTVVETASPSLAPSSAILAPTNTSHGAVAKPPQSGSAAPSVPLHVVTSHPTPSASVPGDVVGAP